MPYCRQCGKEVNAGEAYCRACGAKTTYPGGGSLPLASASTAAVNEEDLAAFVGKNADKYMAKFREFNRGGVDSFSATWHWPAFFFTFWWMLYRKLYAWAALVFFLGCVPYVGFIAMIVFGVTANYIYYKHVRKKILETSSPYLSPVERAASLAREGGVNNVAVVVAPILLIMVIAILAAIAIPQFAQYRLKAYDSLAKREIQNACSVGLSFFAAHPEKTEINPEDFLDAGLKRTPDVDLTLVDGRRGSFELSAKHRKGKTRYTTDGNCYLSEDQQSQDTVI